MTKNGGDAATAARAQERVRQIQALKDKAINAATDEAVEKVAAAGVIATVFGRAAPVMLAAWLMTRSSSLIGTFGAACLLFDAILCMVMLESFCRAALRSALLRLVLAAVFALGALIALPAALAGFVGPIGPFRPVSLPLPFAIGMTLFLAAYGALAVYSAWLLVAHSPDALGKHFLFRAQN